MKPKRQLLIASLATVSMTLWGLVSAHPALANVPGECDLSNSSQFTLKFTPSSASPLIELPLHGFTGTIDWGGANVDSYSNASNPFHNYVAGTPGSPFHVCVTGTATGFGKDGGWDGVEHLSELVKWGDLGPTFSDLTSAFAGATNLTAVPNSLPTSVEEVAYMFDGAVSFNSPIEQWNTSNVWTISGMFRDAISFNQGIGTWNTSNVVFMNDAFSGARAFNKDLSSWNTSNVVFMDGMFTDAVLFTGNINNWNTSSVTDMSFMFSGATAFNSNIGLWNTSSVTDMSFMFFDANSFNRNIGSWNTGSVTMMTSMFEGASIFNQNLPWNVSLVEDMSFMFGSASTFNGDISTWDTSSVVYMRGMFEDAFAFNRDIGNWDVSSVEDMSSLFDGATDFNGDISDWDTSSVESMTTMFRGALDFNQDIGSWDTSRVLDMSRIFDGALSFNQNLNWNTHLVLNTNRMFAFATSFNGDISSWDTGQLRNADGMFLGASSFNQDISGWNTQYLDSINQTFMDASSFNHDLSSWIIPQLGEAEDAFTGSGLSTLNYSKLLKAWATGPHLSLADTGGTPIELGVGPHYFETVEAYRQELINDGWNIIDGGTTSALNPIIVVNPTASSITEGQSLSNSSLSYGSASTGGVFDWTTPAMQPGQGVANQSVTFRPSNDIEYNQVLLSVPVEVLPVPVPPTNPTVEAISLLHTGARVEEQLTLSWILIAGGIIALVTARRIALRRSGVQRK